MGLRRVRTADCSALQLVRIARRYGFVVMAGRKHYKVKTAAGEFVTILPRSARVKRETARAILDALRRRGAEVSFS